MSYSIRDIISEEQEALLKLQNINFFYDNVVIPELLLKQLREFFDIIINKKIKDFDEIQVHFSNSYNICKIRFMYNLYHVDRKFEILLICIENIDNNDGGYFCEHLDNRDLKMFRLYNIDDVIKLINSL